MILNLSASPYHKGKQQFREKMLSVRASDNVTHIAYVNLVGGQDELVFDGNSTVFDEEGTLLGRAAAFQEDLLVVDLQTEHMLRTRLHDIRHREHHFPNCPGRCAGSICLCPQAGTRPTGCTRRCRCHSPSRSHAGARLRLDMAPPGAGREEAAEVYAAVVLGVHDYVNKNGFQKAFIGLCGGIDSSLTAAIAVDALGADRVTGVLLPSPYTSRDSVEDAEELAANLGITTLTVPIAPLYETYLDAIAPACDGKPGDLTAQNIQARIRGNILMALTNQYGGLVLTTGNKSELSVGYATLYGDMAGGFAVLKDIPKTLVYRLCHYFNRLGRADGDPPAGVRQGPYRRTAAEPAGRGRSAALRHPRPDHRGLRGGGPQPAGDRRPGLRPGGGRPGDPHGRPQRVQTPPGAARRQDHPPGLRQGPPHADHQPLRRQLNPENPCLNANICLGIHHNAHPVRSIE